MSTEMTTTSPAITGAIMIGLSSWLVRVPATAGSFQPFWGWVMFGGGVCAMLMGITGCICMETRGTVKTCAVFGAIGATAGALGCKVGGYFPLFWGHLAVFIFISVVAVLSAIGKADGKKG